MGPLIAQLTRMGFLNVSFELITDVAAYKQQRRDVPAEAFALAFVNEHPTFALKELTAHFKADNRTAAACYYAIKKLVEAGMLKALADRNYQRADVKAIEPPREGPSHFATSGGDEILKFARKHGGKFNTAQIIKFFEAQGRARNSVYASCNGLLNDGLIKRVGKSGSGEYVVRAKAAPKPAAPKKPKPAPKAAPHLNGGSEHPVSEVALNG
jgi:predicted transcriptional regulator